MEITPATLLTLNRMARRLRVTVAWLRTEADAGRVPCLRAGNRYLFAPEAVERELAERAARPKGTIMMDRAPTLNSDDAARALLRALRAAVEPPKLLLVPREAAAALGVSQKTLWTLTTPRGPIPALRVGERSLRYSVTALERWIDAQPPAEQGT